jgi:threonine dehydratase
MLKIVRSQGLDLINASGMPNCDCVPNHVRYSVTVDVPNPALFDNVTEAFKLRGWRMNVTNVHASDE